MKFSLKADFFQSTGNQQILGKELESFQRLHAHNFENFCPILIFYIGMPVFIINNQLEIKTDNTSEKIHLNQFDFDALSNRNIVLNQHCYGCTAGAGSSCGGELV